ncbi:DUF2752 domain-containing protein [Micromonospora sp. NPDC000207]|uniref:DUF2752 domain-containing protein n=1 Tax=Micromonospora sp. NPDC000207 TaxID=3154246 RepID=UPI0033272188
MTSVDGATGRPEPTSTESGSSGHPPSGVPVAPEPVAAAAPTAGPYAPGPGHPAGPYAPDGSYPPYAGPPPVPPHLVPESDRLTRFVVRLYDRSPRWVVPLAAVGCVGLGLVYTLASDPTRSAPDAAPSCLLKLTTGLDCPGCGGTRALWYVLHADIPAAARHHFLFVFALPFLAYLFVAWAGRTAFGWRLPELRISPKLIGGFLGVWLAFSVARNLPWEPFTSLYV